MLIQVSRAKGHVVRRECCEKCRCAYRYDLTREVRAVSAVPMLFGLLALSLGPLLIVALFHPFLMLRLVRIFSRVKGGDISGAATEADTAAMKKLGRALKGGVEPVACPQCGWYQRTMVAEVRGRLLPWTDVVAAAVVVGSQVALGVAVLQHRLDAVARHLWAGADATAAWLVVTGVAVTLAAAVLGGRWLLSRSINPNEGHPDPRPPYPSAPPATTEAAWAAKMAADTARLTAPRPTMPRPGVPRVTVGRPVAAPLPRLPMA